MNKALHELDHGRREGGTGGGWPDFATGIGLMYSISFYADHAYLDVAVLMRHYTRAHSARPDSPRLPPERAVQGGGGGGSIGTHMFVYESDGHLLYMDGAPLMVMDKANIVLLEEADSQPPKIISTDSVNDDLGVVNLSSDSMLQWPIKLHQRLPDLLGRSPAVRAFVAR